ncbi:hypothetical protein [Corynebacterium diphtheriae]|uniref:Uncharacterized protein n=2 Tax=Corynebacterium diphtheriae TaxID=1717 RepID=Q6NFR8_CORDI|nr:hypothetical protein [Corynebacterium diphtheriae]AEX49306.1 hypothetical protein CDBH8_1788 [Corynebacterium diphtheriae BH8]ARB87914.1 hypothetical protein A6J36_05850 [Corynebacterium diphtheriae]EIK55655.1 hypothetical protein W5M_08639 [Corynebacterium diphtheriae bv. intermedius str. NCTC 5011]KKA80631.1 hypothetical protein VN94_09835 [Corynebacterium diphtheriae]MBG9334800.1 hypothetical protein [Corynebacterium diphtheriae bv. gravis]
MSTIEKAAGIIQECLAQRKVMPLLIPLAKQCLKRLEHENLLNPDMTFSDTGRALEVILNALFTHDMTPFDTTKDALLTAQTLEILHYLAGGSDD